MKQKAKRIIYYIVGLVLIILSPFLGAIPGPGGFIVFFAGLSILAIHNKWAADLLAWAKDNATNLLDIVFRENKKIQLLNDCIGVLLVSASVALFMLLEPPLRYVFPLAFLASGLFWLLRNRYRYKAFIKKR
jgi:glucose uptake protein GlcU